MGVSVVGGAGVGAKVVPAVGLLVITGGMMVATGDGPGGESVVVVVVGLRVGLLLLLAEGAATGDETTALPSTPRLLLL